MPERIRLSRAKGWRLPAGAVSVARPTRWGNPYRVGHSVYVETPARTAAQKLLGTADALQRDLVLTPALAVELFRLIAPERTDAIRLELAGRDLACWCPLDQPCHADVLLELANEPKETDRA